MWLCSEAHTASVHIYLFFLIEYLFSTLRTGNAHRNQSTDSVFMEQKPCTYVALVHPLQ
jgi:hypothetical protein